MKKVLLLLMFFAIIPAVFADVTIKTNQNIYNIGNGIGASVSVIQANSFEGLFKLSIECGAYKLDYFLTPVSLESNFMSAINIPEITATKSMIGNCTLAGALMSESQVVEQSNSNGFGVTEQLSILPVQSKITALPSDSIQIAGIVNEAFSNNVLKATTTVALDNISSIIEAIGGKFNATIKIPKNIKSGQHLIGISASDSKGNVGTASVELYIIPVPSYLKLDLSGNVLLPGTKINLLTIIFDQADEIINDSLSLELTSPSSKKIFEKKVQSNENIDYEFSQYAEPGLYGLVATYRDLLAQASLNITKVREVKIKYQNESVIVENVGNVVFADELTFALESNSKKYPITKKVEIEQGKTLIIDLSKEVPFGVYSVFVSLQEGFDLVKDKINISSLLPEQKNILADNALIHDNRPLYKKAASGFASVSTLLVGADGILTKNPIVAPMIIFVILLLIFLRYGGKPLFRLIRGRKKEREDDKEENN